MEKTTNLYALNCKSHNEISVSRFGGNFCLIHYDGKDYLAEYKRFLLENFNCPVQLMA